MYVKQCRTESAPRYVLLWDQVEKKEEKWKFQLLLLLTEHVYWVHVRYIAQQASLGLLNKLQWEIMQLHIY